MPDRRTEGPPSPHALLQREAFKDRPLQQPEGRTPESFATGRSIRRPGRRRPLATSLQRRRHNPARGPGGGFDRGSFLRAIRRRRPTERPPTAADRNCARPQTPMNNTRTSSAALDPALQAAGRQRASWKGPAPSCRAIHRRDIPIAGSARLPTRRPGRLAAHSSGAQARNAASHPVSERGKAPRSEKEGARRAAASERRGRCEEMAQQAW